MSVFHRWHEEKQSAWIYRHLAETEPETQKKELFRALAGAAEVQAGILAADLKREQRDLPHFQPTLRARVVTALAGRLGVRRTRSLLAALKVRGLSVYGSRIVVGHAMPVSVGDVGARHRRAGSGGSLRAAVFGVNDGLVSSTSLLLGLAGAAASDEVILMSGVAGLLAGAFSMAAGEYLSVRSQRELFEYQIAEERDELARYPDEEAEELALIYNARGVPLDEARTMTRKLIADPAVALDTLAREELGLNPDELGSPLQASAASFFAFALGGIVPLLPFALGSGASRMLLAATLSGCALFVVGGVLSLFSGRSVWLGGIRMLAIGAAAGLATFGIGRWFGVALA